MSLLPYLFEELSQPTVYDQHFGLGLLDSDLFVQHYPHGGFPHPTLLQPQYQRPLHLSSLAQSGLLSGLSSIKNDRNNFKVNLDVQQFKPEEVSVKVVDGYIVVDGKHEERSDEHGYISRQFTRRYKVPDNVDPNAITSLLSSDGVLSIGAPIKIIEGAKNERSVPIVLTNQPNIKAAPNKSKQQDNNGEQEMVTDQ